MFGKFTREEEADSSLDLPGGDGGTLVVVSKAGGFCSNTFEDVIHERVHDRHSLGGNTSVGVDLLQDFVDVDAVALLPPALLLLVALCNGLLGLTGLLGSLSGGFGWHGDVLTRHGFALVYMWGAVCSASCMCGAVIFDWLYECGVNVFWMLLRV